MRVDMGILIEQMLMFFLILGCGFVGAKVKLLTPEIIQTLSRLIMVLICPMMVLCAFPPAVQYDNAGIVAVSVMPVYAVIYVVLTILSYFLATVLKLRGDKRKIFMSHCLFGNLGFFGLPLVKEIFDPVGVIAFSFCMLVDNLFVWTEGVILTSGTGEEEKPSVKLLLRKLLNPVMVGLVAGLILMAFKVSPDSLVLQSFESIGSCAKPLALIYIGGTIGHMKFGEIKKAWPSIFVIAAKLVIVPIAAYRILSYVGLNQTALEAIVLVLSLPSMASISVMAENFGSAESEYAAQGVFIVTLASLITIPLVMSVCR